VKEKKMAAEKKAVEKYHDVFAFEAGNGPAPGDDPANNAVRVANLALRELHLKAKELDGNVYVTAAYRDKVLVPLQAEALATVERSKSIAERAAAQLEIDEERFWAPPALDPTHGATENRDERICRWFDTLSPEQASAIEAEMAQGKRMREIEALARSPIPGKGKAVGQTYWRAALERKNGPKARALAAQRHVVAWADVSLQAMKRVVMSDALARNSPETSVDKLTRGHAGVKAA
jgi:hypothetical protein